MRRIASVCLKTDAVDHHAGHDLVRCQDIAWDFAGAAIEFELSASERETMGQRVRDAGHGGAEALVAFLEPCYLAFQMGYCREAAASPGPEAAQLDERFRYCKARLAEAAQREERCRISGVDVRGLHEAADRGASRVTLKARPSCARPLRLQRVGTSAQRLRALIRFCENPKGSS